MAVVKAPPDPLIITVENVHHTARRNTRRRLLHHLLKNPRMDRAPSDLQFDLRQLGGLGRRCSGIHGIPEARIWLIENWKRIFASCQTGGIFSKVVRDSIAEPPAGTAVYVHVTLFSKNPDAQAFLYYKGNEQSNRLADSSSIESKLTLFQRFTMQRLLFAGVFALIGLVVLVSQVPARALVVAAPPPGPQRVARAQAIVVGRVVALEDKDVEVQKVT